VAMVSHSTAKKLRGSAFRPILFSANATLAPCKPVLWNNHRMRGCVRAVAPIVLRPAHRACGIPYAHDFSAAMRRDHVLNVPEWR
jgi:hypothetical protein